MHYSLKIFLLYANNYLQYVNNFLEFKFYLKIILIRIITAILQHYYISKVFKDIKMYKVINKMY